VLSHLRAPRPFVAITAAVAVLLALVTLETPAQAAAPDIPTGLTPASGETVSGMPTLTWDRSAGATQYDVQVAATNSFGNVLWSVSTVNSRAGPPIQVPQGVDYWRVRARSNGGTSEWATGSFERADVAAPTLLAPLGDTLKEPDDPPLLSWAPVPGATLYTVQVSIDSSFADSSAISAFTTRTSSLVVSQLKIPTTYYWRVQATVANGQDTAWSDPGSYDLEGLSAPTLVGPPDNINGNVQDIVLDWNPVAGAATYDVQISTDQDFLTLANQASGVVGTSYSPPTTLNNDQYYWRVRPVDAQGNVLDWSDVSVWHFRRNWPDQPTLQYPADNTSVGDPFYYQWTPVHHASRYQVQLSKNADFSTILAKCNTAETTLVPSVNGNTGCMPAALGTYYWRVLAIDDPANPAVLSDVISATVHSFTYIPEQVNQVSPADGASTDLPTMRWDPAPGAAKYQLTFTDTTTGSSASITTAGLSYTPRTLLVTGHTYRWQVQTVSGDGRLGSGLLAGSQPTFTVTAPATPTDSVPTQTNSPSNQERFPTLTWKPVVNATRYRLYLKSQGAVSYTDLGIDFAYPAGEDTGTQYLSPGTYNWIVEAWNGNTLLSTTPQDGTFSIAPMDSTANGRAGLTGTKVTGDLGTTKDTCAATLPSECQNLRQTPVLTWDADPNAGYYQLYFSYDGEMTNMVPDYAPITVYGNMWADTDALPDSQAGSAYFWEAVPCRSNGACAPLQHASLAFNKLSNKVVLHPAVSNSPGSCGQPSDICNDVTLSWDDFLDTETAASTVDTVLKNSAATTEALAYHVQTSSDANFQTLLDNVVVDQTSFTSFANTYPEGPVYWRVQAYDGGNPANPLAWSATGTFTKTSPAPTLLSPSAGGTQSSDQSFSWTPQKFAASYQLEVYKNNDTIGQTSNRVISVGNLVQAAYTPTTQLPVSATPYTWRVRRADAKGRTGPWSSFRSFTVIGAAPTLTSPVAGASVPPSDGIFSWQAVPDAAVYVFERRAAGSTTISESVTTAALAWAPVNSIAGGDWQWRVTAYDSSNQVLASSAWRDFSVVDHPVASTAVSIVGSGAVGTVLSVQAPGWNLSGVTTTYQWKRGTDSISNATGTQYTVTPADVGKDISVVATGAKDGYQNGTSTSNVITGTAGPAPIATAKPTISGKAAFDQVLTTTTGTWPGSPSYEYQWLRDGQEIPGATGAGYRVVAADATRQLSVRVTANVPGLLPGHETSNAVTVAKLTSSTSGYLQSSTVTRKAHGKVVVAVSVPGLSQPTGKVTVKQGKKTLVSATLK
jgi:hypothetical protein